MSVTPERAGLSEAEREVVRAAMYDLAARLAAVQTPHGTSQPNRLGSTEGERDGKQGGVHPDRTRQVAEGSDGRGVYGGSGVLDRSGLDSPSRRAEGDGRRGLSRETAAGHGPAAVPASDGLAAGVAALAEEWSYTTFPDQRTADLMRLDLVRLLATHEPTP